MEIKLYAGKKEPTLKFRMQQEFEKECRWELCFSSFIGKKGNAGVIFCLFGEKNFKKE